MTNYRTYYTSLRTAFNSDISGQNSIFFLSVFYKVKTPLMISSQSVRSNDFSQNGRVECLHTTQMHLKYCKKLFFFYRQELDSKIRNKLAPMF